jgi:hypothetical protein
MGVGKRDWGFELPIKNSNQLINDNNNQNKLYVGARFYVGTSGGLAKNFGPGNYRMTGPP